MKRPLFLTAAMIAAVFFALAAARLEARGDAQEFGDWLLACDNLKTCSAIHQHGYPDSFSIRIRREAGPGGPTGIMVFTAASVAVGRSGEVSLITEGRSPVRLTLTRIAGEDRAFGSPPAQAAAALRFARALGQARSVRLTLPGSPDLREDLAGSRAVLAAMDERQGRASGVTAVVLRGRKDATTTPPAPITPALRSAPPASQAGLPAAPGLLRARPDFTRACPHAPAEPALVARLDPRAFLFALPCASGAYQISYRVYVADRRGGAVRTGEGLGLPGPVLEDVEFNPARATLSAVRKDTQIGNCGVRSDFVWNGREFELTWRRESPFCELLGPAPETYRSRVIGQPAGPMRRRTGPDL